MHCGDLQDHEAQQVSATLSRRRAAKKKNLSASAKRPLPFRHQDLLGGAPPSSRRSRERTIATVPTAPHSTAPVGAGASGPGAATEEGPAEEMMHSEDVRRSALLRLLAATRDLPSASAYARHRAKVVEKALELLDVAASKRSQQQAQELEQLLQQLQI